MSLNKYLILILVPSLSSLIVAQNVVEKLNGMFLVPIREKTEGLACTTIGHLFNAINQYGVPEQGNVSIPNNAPFPIWHFQKGLPKGYTEPIFIHSCPRDNTLQRMFSGGPGHSLLCSNA